MSSHDQTTVTTPETIQSTSFGEFAPPASLPIVTSDRETVAMARGVVDGLWEIPPEVFKALPQKLYEIAMSGTRLSVKAAGVLLDMHQQNGAGEADIEQRDHVVIYIPHNGRDPLPNESATA